MAGVADAVPKFAKDSFYSFKVEHTVIGRDFVIHFFLPEHAEEHLNSLEGKQAWLKYWTDRFPATLDAVAQSFFGEGPPRVTAKYTQEVASWWLRARGFADGISPGDLLKRFFEELDAALRERN